MCALWCIAIATCWILVGALPLGCDENVVEREMWKRQGKWEAAAEDRNNIVEIAGVNLCRGLSSSGYTFTPATELVFESGKLIMTFSRAKSEDNPSLH